MHGQCCIDRGKKIFIESQVMSKVTKCNTDTIPHAAPVITAVHWKSGESRSRGWVYGKPSST